MLLSGPSFVKQLLTFSERLLRKAEVDNLRMVTGHNIHLPLLQIES